jgi:aldehyde:ferredoxin oxidoreductase
LGIEMGDRLESSEHKALMTSRMMDWRTLYNSLTMCVFCHPPADLIQSLLTAATGWDLEMSELLPLGERALTLKRLLNGKLGLTAVNDRLPALLLQPLHDEEVDTRVPDLDVLLPAFYQVRGWDPQTGMPTPGKLQQLGLDNLT